MIIFSAGQTQQVSPYIPINARGRSMSSVVVTYVVFMLMFVVTGDSDD
jgi:hypothetical protein